MTQIIGFVGNQQSGKNTACNYILGLKLLELGYSQKIRITEQGILEVSDILGQYGETEWLSFDTDIDQSALYSSGLQQYIKIYAFADHIKEIATKIFGIPPDMIYGTDEQKNQLTSLLWEDMPGVITVEIPQDDVNAVLLSCLTYHKPGLMTGREFMRYFGTEICRKMYNSIWIDSLVSRIETEAPEIALISDVRFINECQALSTYGAHLIMLKRNLNPNAEHASEKEVYLSKDMVHHTIDNSKDDIKKFNQKLYKHIAKAMPNLIPTFDFD